MRADSCAWRLHFHWISPGGPALSRSSALPPQVRHPVSAGAGSPGHTPLSGLQSSLSTGGGGSHNEECRGGEKGEFPRTPEPQGCGFHPGLRVPEGVDQQPRPLDAQPSVPASAGPAVFGSVPTADCRLPVGQVLPCSVLCCFCHVPGMLRRASPSGTPSRDSVLECSYVRAGAREMCFSWVGAWQWESRDRPCSSS